MVTGTSARRASKSTVRKKLLAAKYEAYLLRYAGSVEQASEHAVAAAITALARTGTPEPLPLADADGFTALPGLGARGVVDGHEVVVGRSRLFADRGLEVPAGLAGWCGAREQAG